MITTEMVKKLRESTGAGVMACKKTLDKTGGDINKAIETLKEQETVLAAQKAQRAVSQGLIGVHVSDNQRIGALVEINCETDFVAMNEDFVELVDNFALLATISSSQDREALLQEKYMDSAVSVQGTITAFIAKCGENIKLSRLIKLSSNSGIIQSYSHGNGKIGVLVELACSKHGPVLEHTAKEIAMQVAAMNPLFVDRNSANRDLIEQEEQRFRNQALSEEKPADIQEKIVMGKINKFLKKNCLIEQPWIKNEEMTIAELLKESSAKLGVPIIIAGFCRLELGKNHA